MKLDIDDCVDHKGVSVVEVATKDTLHDLYQKAAIATSVRVHCLKLIAVNTGLEIPNEKNTITHDVLTEDIKIKAVPRSTHEVKGPRDLTIQGRQTIAEMCTVYSDLKLILDLRGFTDSKGFLRHEAVSEIPSTIKHIKLTDIHNSVLEIGPCFMQFSRCVSIEFSNNFSSLRAVGDNFLSDATLLTSIDLTGLSSVRKIGRNFVKGCASLTSIDLQPLRNIISLPSGSLSQCCGLRNLDLNPLQHLQEIGEFAISSCTALETVNTSTLSFLRYIRRGAISSCSVSRIEFVGLKSLRSIGSLCFSENNNLNSLVLSGLPLLESIGHEMGSGCPKLSKLELTDLPKLAQVGVEAFFGSPLESVNSDGTPDSVLDGIVASKRTTGLPQKRLGKEPPKRGARRVPSSLPQPVKPPQQQSPPRKPRVVNIPPTAFDQGRFIPPTALMQANRFAPYRR
eukprot:TRINITY_DN21589_c0_g1_i1.p1 TRINITY_DN21589_c0_g1~~TRINITY_DN21589_c0_g1_i1.p1  ORF type:complete len:453 (+),score=19.89 TRINITY_DN21589_c0_g1_i1:55-1413(+)